MGTEVRVLTQAWLPPGRYRLAALVDVESDEWLDPAFLERLLPASMAFDLSEGQRLEQDLRAGG